MAGARHHTIPAFLLRGFRSRGEGAGSFVWVYRRGGGDGIEVHCNNVAVERHFYGKPEESDLDQRITELEATTYAPMVGKLRDDWASFSSPVSDHGIPELVAHLATRRRHMRRSMLEAIEESVQRVAGEIRNEQVYESLVAAELASEGRIRNQMEDFLVLGGLGRTEAATLVRERPRDLAQMLASSRERDDLSVIDSWVAIAQQTLPHALREAWIASMSEVLHNQPRADPYAALTWFVMPSSQPLCLGDSVCLFEMNGKRRFKPFHDVSDDLVRVYLPLSSRRILVGSRSAIPPVVNVKEVNRAVCRCSSEFVVSSTPFPAGSPLTKGIGDWSGLMDPGQMERIIGEILRDLE